MKSTRVCLVVPAEPDLEWKSLLLQYSAKQRLQYLKGDLMRRYDLIRARLDMASACFILTDQYCSDTDKADSVTFLRALAVSKFNRNIKCFVELIEPENKKHLLAVGISHHRIVCCREIRMGLLAQATLMKGFSALVSNVVASSSVTQSLPARSISGSFQRPGPAAFSKATLLLPQWFMIVLREDHSHWISCQFRQRWQPASAMAAYGFTDSSSPM